MASWYKVKYSCVACGNRREIDTKNKIRNFTHRRCSVCRKETEKVIYLGLLTKSVLNKSVCSLKSEEG